MSWWYEGHSINKEFFWKTLFTVEPFSRKSIVMGSFISLETVSINFFPDCCTQNFLFTRESVFLLYGLSFQFRVVVANSCLVYIFFIKIYFTVHITHFSVNFTWFALLSCQKFWWQTSVQAKSILFDLSPFWITSKEIFLQD